MSVVDPSTVLTFLLQDKFTAVWFLMFTKGVVYLCKDFQRKVYLGPLKDRQQASFLEAGKKKQQQMYNKCQAWYMRHIVVVHIYTI